MKYFFPGPRNLAAKLDSVVLLVFGSNERDKKARRTGKEAWFGLLRLVYHMEGTVRHVGKWFV